MSKKKINQPRWQTTWLWITLESRAKKKSSGAASFLSALDGWMKKIDKVLDSGGTSPNDFTLHDSEHSFRVAERMIELMAPTVRKNLSDYETALLLLSAYCHDLGMTPARAKVTSHHRYLFDPAGSTLTIAETQSFQRFLDDYHDHPISIPLCTKAPTTDDLNLADELTAFYVRHQHNNWSAEWIRENLNGEFSGFGDWKETLVRLCQSHHLGFEELKQADYDPRPVGSPPQILHLRFLACLLRLADILENDPERTPQVIFRHRDIEDRRRSVVHWQKDHDLTLDLQGNRIRFHARPRSARIHKALLQLADWIDDELHGIAQLGEKLPTIYQIGKSRITREWNLASATVRDIEAAPRTYEFIEGAFRPNTARLLHLLSGEQLYHGQLAGVRELLQNAFDAVREKIARRRLQSNVENPADPSLEERYGNEELVTLTLQLRTFEDEGRKESQLWLQCEDSGVGLTKAIITSHLLVSGQSRRHEISELERRCEAAGFTLGRTGQFGIGVLSYFMLASEVHITTTRFQGCGDLDAAGWMFSTRGVGDFGELRRLNNSLGGSSGTRVEWRLRTEKCGAFSEFAQQLFKFLKETLVRVPCVFRYKAEGLEGVNINWEKRTGWTRSEAEILASVSSRWSEPNELDVSPEHLLSKVEIEQQQRTHELYPEWLEKARAATRCEIREISLPDGLGKAHLALPFFQLKNGRSLAFIFADTRGYVHQIRKQNSSHALHLTTETTCAWKGITTTIVDVGRLGRRGRGYGYRFNPCEVAIDLMHVDNSSLQVSRNGISIPEDAAQRIRNCIEMHVTAFINDVLSVEKSYAYNILNSRINRIPITLTTESGWVVKNTDGVFFEQISFPLIGTSFGLARRVTDLNGNTIRVLAMSKHVMGLNDDPVWPYPSFIKVLERKTRHNKVYLQAMPFWAGPSEQRDSSSFTSFPSEWHSLILIELPGKQICINSSNPLIQLLDEPQRKELQDSNSNELIIPWNDIEQATSPRDAAWSISRVAISIINYTQQGEWEKYQKNHLDKVRKLWSLAKEIDPDSESRAIMIQTDDRLLSLSPEKTEQTYFELEFYPGKILLPKVTDPAWILREEDKSI